MGTRLSFLGAAGTVTGSRYLVETDRARILVDCGLFQGLKTLRLRNWAPFPVDPAGIDAVVLTHAHIDHSGYLPRLVREGFSGPVYATPSTVDLCGLLLPDSGFLQEKDAERANRHGYTRHAPALPLYTQAQAERALDRLVAVPVDTDREIAGGIGLRFHRAGHILGAAGITLAAGGRRLVFSGDLGRPDDPVLYPPEPVRHADYLVVESTYGDRRHDDADPETALAAAVNDTAARGGTVLVPAFAVGRAQALLLHIHRLKRAGRIPDLPVFLDSPMAIDASGLYERAHAEHRLSAAEARAAFGAARCVRDVEESKALNGNRMPKIILSASGMATGGRVLHHLRHLAPDGRNTILLAGYQAAGTRGAALAAGARSLRIHGEEVAVRARVETLPMMSAHADADQILGWLGGFTAPPRATFVTHGEPVAADTLRRRIQTELGWACTVPEQGQSEVLP